ncbi:hypothetical protein [Pseudomonas sp. NPDC089569]|uniref:hypothetical protein n=1 Tax=Pseudomonas sp. NPDC089569 TaxID=3390722 RepID=UPI003D05BC49
MNDVLAGDVCGSWLSSEGGVSVGVDFECVGPIAGKPAPTETASYLNDVFAGDPCGSGLAREGGVSVGVDFECVGPIAGLPAKAVYQSALILKVLPYRWQASSHRISVVLE